MILKSILIDHNAVIGMAFDAWMMTPNWEEEKPNRLIQGY